MNLFQEPSDNTTRFTKTTPAIDRPINSLSFSKAVNGVVTAYDVKGNHGDNSSKNTISVEEPIDRPVTAAGAATCCFDYGVTTAAIADGTSNALAMMELIQTVSPDTDALGNDSVDRRARIRRTSIRALTRSRPGSPPTASRRITVAASTTPETPSTRERWVRLSRATPIDRQSVVDESRLAARPCWWGAGH
jgi:hypothetical protein